MVGVASAVTVRLAVLLAVPAVGVCVVVTPEVVFGLEATLVLVTLKMMVQLLLAATEILLKLRAVWPAVKEAGMAPQVPVTLPAVVLMFTSVSETEPPLRAVPALLLAIVRVTTEVPPDGMDVGLNALLIVGGPNTVRVAVLLTAPAVGV
jgi:hypothetical protein